MKNNSLPYVLLLIAVLFCLNLWDKNRRLKRDLHIAETKLSFTNANAGNSVYDSVYAHGDTIAFYKQRKLVRTTVTEEW